MVVKISIDSGRMNLLLKPETEDDHVQLFVINLLLSGLSDYDEKPILLDVTDLLPGPIRFLSTQKKQTLERSKK